MQLYISLFDLSFDFFIFKISTDLSGSSYQLYVIIYFHPAVGKTSGTPGAI